LYSLRCNSLIIVRIADWRPCFFPARVFHVIMFDLVFTLFANKCIICYSYGQWLHRLRRHGRHHTGALHGDAVAPIHLIIYCGAHQIWWSSKATMGTPRYHISHFPLEVSMGPLSATWQSVSLHDHWRQQFSSVSISAVIILGAD
jgi:hypothetical protein